MTETEGTTEVVTTKASLALTDVAGVGEARAEALAGLGIGTVKELAAADPEEIAEGIAGVGMATARGWIEGAVKARVPGTGRAAELG